MYIDGLMFGIIYVLCLCVGSGCGENVYVIVRYCRHLVDQTTPPPARTSKLEKRDK